MVPYKKVYHFMHELKFGILRINLVPRAHAPLGRPRGAWALGTKLLKDILRPLLRMFFNECFCL